MNATFSIRPRCSRHLAAWLAGLALLLAGATAVNADHGTPVRIGVLHLRGAAVARQAWSPMIDHFSRQLPGTHFELVPLDYAQLGPAVEQRLVDFIFTAAGQYVDLELAYG